MNKKIVKRITLLFLFIIGFFIINSFWNIGNYINYLIKEPVDYKIIDPSTGENYTHERKFRYVLSPKIDSLIFSDNPRKALKLIDSLMPKYQNEIQLYFDKGLSLTMIDSFELAIKHFDKVLSYVNTSDTSRKKGLRYRNSLYYKFRCLSALKKYDEALNVLEQLLEFDSDYKIEIASIYELKNDYKNSIKYYKLTQKEYEESKDSLRLWKEIQSFKDKILELEKLERKNEIEKRN